ncbi:MAG: hypothetical protein KAJ63_05895 [Methyloprofundus sp.]|nr:hypothetical protein [Methyloprofundus sp.]
MNKFRLLPLLLMLFIVSCANNSPGESPDLDKEVVRYTGTGTLNISPVVFAKDLPVSDAVLNECKLLTKLPEFVQSYAQDQYADIQIQSSASNADVLNIKIVGISYDKKNVWSGRGAHQWVAIQGSLLKNGNKIASFDARRSSMGGFFGGYKGTCSLLGRCVKTLGKDIAGWLKNPIDGAKLGNM